MSTSKSNIVLPVEFTKRLFPQASRGIHRFAKEEVILPRGPMKGTYYNSAFMPFYDIIMDAMMDDHWRRLAVVGPTQAGKSLICTNIPLLYFLFEKQEDVIFGIPNMDLAKGMWMEKIYPVIAATQYRDLLPDRGAGSKGGVPTSIMLKNGVNIRFMGAGGSDAQRSSHTARVIIMSEVDKMDDAGDASEEADPVSQIMMRADSFADTSKIIMECTVTHSEGRIWQEAMVNGSGGQFYVPCPECGGWQTLKKDGLVFDEENEVTAEETARYKCEHCEVLLDDGQRRSMLDTPVIVHKGQSIDASGNVTGDLPPTRTFGAHYNVLYSPMQSLGKTASQQWEADRSELENIKKAMVQSKWAEPWGEGQEDQKDLSFSYLRGRSVSGVTKLKEVPDFADWLVMTVDVQKRWMYWTVEAMDQYQSSQLVDYGVIDIMNDSDDAMKKALDEANDIAEEGWHDMHGALHTPMLKLVDTGYRYDVIGPWLQTQKSWRGVKGTSRGNRPTGDKASFQIPGILQIRRQPDGNFLWFVEVDSTKAIAHDRYFLEVDQHGYVFVPMDLSQGYMMSVTAEKRDWDEKGDGFKWVKIRRRNDYLDCKSYSVAGGFYLAQREGKLYEQKIAREAKNLSESDPNSLTANHRAKLKRRKVQSSSWFAERRQ